MKPPLSMRLGIDPDMVWKARQYINAQIAIMEKHGDKPELSETQMEKLIADVLKPMIQAQRRRAVTGKA